MQTINYLIVDGDVSGRVKCSIDESTIIAYRISRKHLSKGVDAFDKDNWTGKSGIYLLITRNNSDKPSVYIGQADQRKNGDGFIARLSEHIKDENKGEWYEVVLLTVKDDYPIPLNALEHKFWEDAIKNNRCDLNQIEPHDGKITYERQGFFDNFVKYGEFFVGILGHKIYEAMAKQPIAEISAPTLKAIDDEIFKYSFKKNTLAYGRRTDEGFVVLKGAKISHVRSSKNGEIREQTKRLYDKIESDRAERDYAIDKSKWETTEDLLFGSANEAGAFVAYGLSDHINHWIETKTKKSLNTIQKEEAEALAKN